MNKNLTGYEDHLKVFPVEKIILEEGINDPDIYVINEGIVKIQKKINGKDTLLNLLGKGRVFGGFSLSDKETKALYSAVVLENCRLLVLNKGEFLEIFHKDHNISFETLKQFDYNNRSILIVLSDFIEKGEINHIVTSFLSYRELKESNGHVSEDMTLTKEVISGLTCTNGDELEKNIEMLLEMNVFHFSNGRYVLSHRNELEKCLSILNMKRRRISKQL
jgi:CRP-like cAMP-binding protein